MHRGAGASVAAASGTRTAGAATRCQAAAGARPEPHASSAPPDPAHAQGSVHAVHGRHAGLCGPPVSLPFRLAFFWQTCCCRTNWRKSMSALENPVYRFGGFELEPAERRLSEAGKPIALTPKVFDTLVLLVERAGHVVSKDELMKAPVAARLRGRVQPHQAHLVHPPRPRRRRARLALHRDRAQARLPLHRARDAGSATLCAPARPSRCGRAPSSLSRHSQRQVCRRRPARPSWP